VTPRKDGYFDHEIDALRYGVWNLFGVTMSSLRPEEVMTSLVRKN
jgi:hypothetical protein